MDFHVLGVSTNIAYVLDVLAHPEFLQGKTDTGFLGRAFADWSLGNELPEGLAAVFSAGSVRASVEERTSKPAWDAADGWRIGRTG